MLFASAHFMSFQRLENYTPRIAKQDRPSSMFFKAGMGRAGLHEICASSEADGIAATGFALAHAGQLLAASEHAKRSGTILWARHDMLQFEAGSIYPPGLVEFCIAPSAIIMVRARGVLDTLQAGLDAVRCGTLSAVLVEFWGLSRAYNLTASRKLSLAAKKSDVALFLLRHNPAPLPSAAETRWSVRSLASRPFSANAPGRPAFEVTLLRHRGGKNGQQWHVEWNRDAACFEEHQHSALPSTKGKTTRPQAPLSGNLAAFPAHRQISASNDEIIIRKTG